MTAPKVQWPGGHSFAFSIFDDTDWTTLENGPPIYDLLTESGIHVTKSVWPTEPTRWRTTGGSTCEDPAYLAWVLELQSAGHEIGFHNATDHPSTRAETISALDAFRSHFGHDPRVGADHAGNKEALYWGPRRLTGVRRKAYSVAERIAQPRRPGFSGEDPDSPYYWGDVCRDRIEYWRNFTFAATNVLDVCPMVTYHDPERPLVNKWFASTHAPRLEPFLNRLAPPQLDRLEASGGLCLIYTHFGIDFAPDGQLDGRFAATIADLSRRNGWFAPVSEILDHLVALRSPDDLTITRRHRRQLEQRWILDRTWNARRIGPSVVTTEG